MIIQCPSCGFSGRVPGYAATAAHHARCPKCQFRFSIADRAAPIVDPLDGASRPDLRHDLTRPRLDPSSSSYEIKALADDFSDDEYDEREWSDDWGGGIEADEDDPPTARPVKLPPFLRKSNDPPPRARTDWFRSARVDPSSWYSRLYQAWAVVFLAWAAILSLRGVAATIRRSEDDLFSMPMIGTVSSVVLLVAASAGLFLLIDFHRRRPALATGPTQETPASSPAVEPPSPRRDQGTAESMTMKPRKLSAG